MGIGPGVAGDHQVIQSRCCYRAKLGLLMCNVINIDRKLWLLERKYPRVRYDADYRA